MLNRRVLVNGKIYTVNKAQPWAEAVVIEGNKIIYVGNRQGAEAYLEDDTVTEDLGGRLMTPGLIDGHLHAVCGVVLKRLLRFAPDDDLEMMKKRIRDYIEAYPDEPAYMGMGWNDSYFGVEGPNRAILDEICPDKPMVLLSSSAHTGWGNSKSLEIAGITRDTPDPNPEANHIFVRDKDGEPTGYFKESGCISGMLSATKYFSDANLAESAVEFAQESTMLGLTSLVDCGNYSFAEHLMNENLLKELEDKDCPVRLNACGLAAGKIGAEEAFDEAVKLHARFKSDRFNCNFLKLVNDGTLESFSAAIPNKFPGGAEVLPTFTADELATYGKRCSEAGLNLHVHAIGSVAVHGVLEAAGKLRAEGYKDIRITCAHTGYVFPEDMELFKKYDVLANSTGLWFSAMPKEAHELASQLTNAKAYPLKTIHNTGAKIGFSSDYPTELEAFYPMLNIEVAVTRQPVGQADGYVSDPEERLSVAEVIEGYTLSNAYQMQMEDKLGSIEVGKLADLVVFEQNLFEIEPHTIHAVKVYETIMDGVTRYKRV